MEHSQTTIVAIATPSGRGGIGIIRISGPESLSFVSQLTGKDRSYFQPRKSYYCGWYDQAKQDLDSGLVLYFNAPHSYTGEDVVELQGHGSPLLLQATVNCLLEMGAVMAQPGEFTRRAVENNKLNLSQAEAVISCIDAQTIRAAKQAKKHLDGLFGDRIYHLMDLLIDAVAHIEATLDFPEDEIPDLFFETIANNVKQSLIAPIDGYLSSAIIGERLFNGVTIAIIGAPNVGKSSLLNLLVERNRAIVSATPGTTRDVLEIDFEIGGIPVRLLDTAGMRSTGDEIELEGIRRASEAAEAADVVLFVADASNRATWDCEGAPSLLIMNKVELLEGVPPASFIGISIHEQIGLDRLKAALIEILAADDSAVEGLYVTSARHRQALAHAKTHLLAGLCFIDSESSIDLLALEWRRAWMSLAEIVGMGDIENILDRVFSKFCVGK
ncbi:MAG: tRNA uridine-5-carboxymethylaminomethyl(34) synthesis GTPase MnmE [Zetaproteobacteria bacterium]|nr:tRNA uridine-5-carboxymethylaminomethyl(34) synthesis GTPase MnmE [Zetaproteobacteria bacterium]